MTDDTEQANNPLWAAGLAEMLSRASSISPVGESTVLPPLDPSSLTIVRSLIGAPVDADESATLAERIARGLPDRD